MTDTLAAYDPSGLPASVSAYLDAHDDGRHADSAAMFTQDATVLDDGQTYEGIDAITAWIEKSSTEYTYSSTRIGQSVTDGAHAVVTIRLDGDFPGGTVTLRYTFELDGGFIRRLAIEI